MLIVAFVICNLLIIRVGFIQFVQGAELQAKAYAQREDRNLSSVIRLALKKLLETEQAK